ncbi:MAG: HlyC/CorC family transporter [Gammaproteobacteria bacterium]
MQELPLIISVVFLFILLVFSAFFSSSETAMMTLNRYRLHHLAKSHKNKSAQRAERLLKRPDRLLGTILIGNTFSNILASALATVIAVQVMGEVGVLVSAIVLTLIVLIFGEIMPKTVAAHYPERLAFILCWPLGWIFFLLYPLVILTNGVVNGILYAFGMRKPTLGTEHVTIEELRTIVAEHGKTIPTQSKNILLGLIDLKEVTVDEVMVPRNEITGIDLQEDWDTISMQLAHSRHTRIPLFQDTIDNVTGMLHMRDLVSLFNKGSFNKEGLINAAEEIYFIPEGTSLMKQLTNFQNSKKRIGLVVDEYGDIQGLVTLEDILEEVIGKYTSDISSETKYVHPQEDGTFIIDATMAIRELNRMMSWELPTEGAKTLSGVIIEYLELIPHSGTCLRLNGYPLEVLTVKDNKIETIRVYPDLRIESNE